MKHFLSCVAVASLMIAGAGLVGCQSTPQSAQGDNHDALFGGGNGEFGESPRIAGDYSPVEHQKPSGPSVANDQ